MRRKVRPPIEPDHIDQLLLEDVVVLASVRTPYVSGVVAMHEAAFHQLAAPTEQALAVVALHPRRLAYTACCWPVLLSAALRLCYYP